MTSPGGGLPDGFDGPGSDQPRYKEEKKMPSRDKIKAAILTLKEAPKPKLKAANYSHMDPQDLTEGGVPYDDYSSPCIESHPFGGGISAGDY